MTVKTSVTHTSGGVLLSASHKHLSVSRHVKAISTDEEIDKHMEAVKKELANMIEIDNV